MTGLAASAVGAVVSAAADAAASVRQAVSGTTDSAKPAEQPFRLDVSDDEDDFNLSDDDDDDSAAALIKKKAAEAVAAKAKNKPAARSAVIWDIKPEDDETNMDELEKGVRAIKMEGLEWQASERVPVAYGIVKLRIIAQIVDDLVPTDDLQENIEQIQGVQSSDIFAFNKV